jgi:hypothetical protein
MLKAEETVEKCFQTIIKIIGMAQGGISNANRFSPSVPLLIQGERPFSGVIMIEIIEVMKKDDILSVKELFKKYACSLNVDLSFQNFNRELDDLPGDYCHPYGCLLLARCDGNVAGCVALRKFEERFCEMKRLYVRPGYRGKGVGKKLSISCIKKAQSIGYY